MLRASRREADVVHFQWLAVQPLDQHLLRAYSHPRVITAHDVLPREPVAGQQDAQRQLYERMDAIVVHTEHGRARLVDELGVPERRVHVIAHGILRPAGDAPLPPELPDYDGTVVLCFGLMRPYKGIDVLVEAWQGIEHAELWIVGAPRMDTAALRASAPPGVRFVERFVSEGEAAALFRRADLAVLPYREIEQSEIAAAGAAELVAPGDPAELHDALAGLLADPSRLATLAMSALRLADESQSWDAIARAHLALYDSLLA